MPLTSTELTFTVAKSLPIGTYETTVYLTGSQEIATPLNVTVTSEGQVPLWSVNPRDFENSMNVIGQVKLDGQLMNDEKDMLAAFIGDECRGIAHPVYKERYDEYFVTMDIYGGNDSDKPVTFRVYDASTGTLYPEVVADKNVTFQFLELNGTYSDPVALTVIDKIEQTTVLKEGWNWLSFYVKADTMKVESLLRKIADDVETIKSQDDGYLSYENGAWGGSLDTLSNVKMYAIKMKADRTLRIVGQTVQPSDNRINLSKGWNWIGYYGSQISSITDAFAEMSPKNGDILKGQYGVSYYDQYEWAGSLMMMEPGVGYMVNTDSIRTFSYPGSSVSHASRRTQTRGESVEADNNSRTFQPVDFRNYSSNAIMAARVMSGNIPMANIELGVFADGECRAVAVTNEKGIAYLTIPGDDATELTFKIAQGDNVIDSNIGINYEADAIYGSPFNPIVFDFGKALMNDNESVYDLQGRRITQPIGTTDHKIIIINGQKQLVR
jgi:hypothetical protein